MYRNNQCLSGIVMVGLISVLLISTLRADTGAVSQLQAQLKAEQAHREMFVSGKANSRTRSAFAKELALYSSKMIDLLQQPTGELGADNFRVTSGFANVIAREGSLVEPLEMPDSQPCLTARRQVVRAWDDLRSSMCGTETPPSTDLIVTFRRNVEAWEKTLAPHIDGVKPGYRTKLREHLKCLKVLGEQISTDCGLKFIQSLAGCASLQYEGTIGGLAEYVLNNNLEIVPGSKAQQLLAQLNTEMASLATKDHEQQLVAAREAFAARIARANATRLTHATTRSAAGRLSSASYGSSSYSSLGSSSVRTYSVPYTTYRRYSYSYPVTRSYSTYTTRTVRVR